MQSMHAGTSLTYDIFLKVSSARAPCMRCSDLQKIGGELDMVFKPDRILEHTENRPTFKIIRY